MRSASNRPDAWRRLLPTLVLVLACGDDGAPPSPSVDAGATLDARVPEAPADAGFDAALEASVDAGSPVRTAAELAVRGAANLDDNRAGLISGATLKSWLASWRTTRSREGDLIVLQLNPLPGERAYGRGTEDAQLYASSELTTLITARSNGLLALGGAPETGLRVDTFLRKYGIHPSRDLVVLAAGQLTPGSLDLLARAWLTLRYWGLPHEALGVLDAPLDEVLSPEQRGTASEVPPVDGVERVSELGDQFVVHADTEAVRAALGNAVLLDVRGPEPYAGTTFGSSTRDSSCTAGTPRCTPLLAGHIQGARNLPWSALVDSSGRLRPRDELDSALRALGIDGTAIVYDDDDQGAALVSFALLAVVGVPARWYGGSYLEWGSLDATHPTLPALELASPHRTDALIEGARTHAPDDRAVRPLVLDPRVPTLDRVVREDRAYKRTPPPLPPPGQGDNPCIL